jgi:5-hydroxyisourate hydrolase
MAHGYLTTHVLDTAKGIAARGMKIELFRLSRGSAKPAAPEMLAEMVTNDDGRTDAPILQAAAFAIGQYDLVFHVGAYLDAVGSPDEEPRFLDVIPIRFGISDLERHYHVPLLISPYGYSTYRGS